MKKQESARRQVLTAINQMDRRVTIADVVTKTGLSLHTVSSIINDIAHEAQAHLEVTTQGIIYYIFPGNLNYVYFSNRILHFLHRIWERISPVMTFLFRISFGLVLLFSIALVFFIMFIIQVMVSVLSGHTGNVGQPFKEFYYLIKRLIKWNFIPPSLFRRGDMYTPGYKRSDTVNDIRTVSDTADNTGDGSNTIFGFSTAPGLTDGDRGFLLNCYYFLFGSGDPNEHYFQLQAKHIAQLIRNNNGVLLPEQLAPYTGTAPDEPEELFHILSSFNGYPEATESGHLVYVFPDMQATGTEAGLVSDYLPPLLRLNEWNFADISKAALKPVILTALFNFFGTLFFFWLLFAARTSSKSLELLFFVLALYGLFFLFFPAYRWVTNFFKNIEIRNYNERVEEYEAIVKSDHPELQEPRIEAAKLREKLHEKAVEKLEYTTTRDYLEQEADKILLEGDPLTDTK